MRGCLHERQWPRTNFDPAFANRGADGVRLGRGIDERKRRPELFQSMDIRIRHDWFTHAPGPADGRMIEVIQLRCVEGIQLDSIEEIRMSFEEMAQTATGRVIGMRGNHQTVRLRSPKLPQFLEAVDAFRSRIEIEQQHVFAIDRAFNTGNERDTASPRVFGNAAHVEPAVVQRNREDVIPKERQLDRSSRSSNTGCNRAGRQMCACAARFLT